MFAAPPVQMVESGRVVLKEGDRGARFFVIISGHAVVTITDPIQSTERDANTEEATEFPESIMNAGADNDEGDGGDVGVPEGKQAKTQEGTSGNEPSDKAKPSVADTHGGIAVHEPSDEDKPGVAATSASEGSGLQDKHDKEREGAGPSSASKSTPASSHSGTGAKPSSAGSAIRRLMSLRTMSRTESSRFKVGDSVFSTVLAGSASVKVCDLLVTAV